MALWCMAWGGGGARLPSRSSSCRDQETTSRLTYYLFKKKKISMDSAILFHVPSGDRQSNTGGLPHFVWTSPHQLDHLVCRDTMLQLHYVGITIRGTSAFITDQTFLPRRRPRPHGVAHHVLGHVLVVRLKSCGFICTVVKWSRHVEWCHTECVRLDHD